MERRRPLKQKRESSEKSMKLVCIVHVEGLKHGELQLLSDCKDPQMRLAKLQDIKKNRRLAQSLKSSHRMKETCDRIPSALEKHHGFHWQCYKRFTANLDRLDQTTSKSLLSKSTIPRRMRRRSSLDSDKVILKPDCILCGSDRKKKVKVKGVWTTQGMSNFEFDGWKSVVEMAEMKYDKNLLTRIRGHDLFACEAKFHKNCRTKYMQKPEKWQSTDEENRQMNLDQTEAHMNAFSEVCHIVETEVLQQQKIVKLVDLRQVYISSLEKTSYSNPNYRGENLKNKLEKYEPFKDRLSFCNMGQFQSYIVYSSQTDVNTAVKHAFQLGSINMVQNVGSHVHQLILDGFAASQNLKWPPMPQDLENVNDLLPNVLDKLLCYIISGKSTPVTSRVQRLVNSIGQDICRAATNGSWKLPKHVLICMSLRHLFRSDKLITLLNRMGHCENYSFSLELETALAEATDQSSTLLSNQIIRSPSVPSVFHSQFDNFDQLLNDLTGKGSIHTAHGIMLQDVECDDHGGSHPKMPSMSRTGQRSLKLQQQAFYLTVISQTE